MCVSPIDLSVVSRTFGTRRCLLVPCGKCVDCLKTKQNSWKLRLCKEAGFYSHVYFFTLTYRNDKLPCHVYFQDTISEPLYSSNYCDCCDFVRYAGSDDMVVCSSACKREIQLFIKAMRTDFNRKHSLPLNSENFRYFICSEYGPNPNGTKRPHYHGIIFSNYDLYKFLPYFNQWAEDKGRMEFVEVGIEREDKSSVANYISKYCAKGCFESRIEDIQYERIEPAWYIMSKNIGLRWLEQNKQQWLQYCPLASSIGGDWCYEDIVEWFNETENHFVCQVRQEIDNLIDHLKISDGDYMYKLPRYYRERLFCVQKTFINNESGKPQLQPLCSDTFFYDVCKLSFPDYAHVWCGPLITYEVKERKDTRYVSENFLSNAIAYCLSERTFANERHNFQAFRENNPSLSLRDCYRLYSHNQWMATETRKVSALSSLRDFYETNMWAHREFDYD